MTVPAVIRRSFGIEDDSTFGGTNLERLLRLASEKSGLDAGGKKADEINTLGPASTGAAISVIPKPTIFYAATGGTIDPKLERTERTTEVRGRRANVPHLSFRAAPVASIPFPAYRTTLDKLLKKALGGKDNVTGEEKTGFLHEWTSLGFPTAASPAAVQLPAFFAQMVRDDLVHMLSGCMVDKVALTFGLDGQGTAETEIWSMFYGNQNGLLPESWNAAAKTLGPIELQEQENLLFLRDAKVSFSGSHAELATPTAPTVAAGSGYTGSLAKAKYNYIIVAYNANGFTKGSPEMTTPPEIEGAAKVTWSPVANAYGYRVYGRKGSSGEKFLLADVGNALEFIDTGAIATSKEWEAGKVQKYAPEPPTENTTGGYVPDLIGFDFSFMNNLVQKWYAGRNIGRALTGAGSVEEREKFEGRIREGRTWFPTEYKLSGAQDVTYGLTFGNTNTCQDFNRDYDTIQSIKFTVEGGPIPKTEPVINEALSITIYSAVSSDAGGPDALAARGDETFRMEGNAFYSQKDAKDVLIESLSGVSAEIK